MSPIPRLLAISLLSLAAAGGVPAETVKITRGPYPQAAAPDAMHLVWRVRSNTVPVVHYGLSPDKLDHQTPDTATVTRRIESEGASTGGAKPLGSAPAETRQYETTIKGLKPDTLYYYAIYDGPSRLTQDGPTYSFRTLPAPGAERPLLMWVVGDSGTGNKVQAKIHTVMRDWLAREKRSLDLYLHVGDMAYGSGMDSEFQGYFFQPYDATLRNTVCWPAFGNHEGRSSRSATGTGPYYDAYVTPTGGESGGVPSGTESYYSFDAGRVHFISLNSFDTSRQADGAMAQWLKADLEKTKADWLIAFFHHPPYTKGTHDSDDVKHDRELVEMRENIMPILEGAGVDLVLCGHSHIYERSMFIDGAYATPTVASGVVLNDGDGNPKGDGPYRKSAGLKPHAGTVAVVAGHGGTTLGRMKTPSPVMRTTLLEFGSVLLDLKGDTLTSHMLNSSGVITDTFQIIKRGDVPVTRLASPRPATVPPGPSSVPAPASPKADAGGSLPANAVSLIPKGAIWQYLAGTDPGEGWQKSLTGSGWKSGPAGFGYEDGDDATEIQGMRGKFRYLCVRREFELTGREDLSRLSLGISYDDGFICYLNGKEVIRENVAGGSLGSAKGVSSHEAAGFKMFSLASARALLKPGKNLIAFEVHNDDLKSSDLTLHPVLLLTGAAPGAGSSDAPASDD